MSNATPLILLVVLILAFYLIVMRPARAQQRNQAELQRTIEVGDRVVISAGVFGTVASLEESRVRLEIAPGTVIEVARQVVVRRADDAPEAGEAPAAGEAPVEKTAADAVPAPDATDSTLGEPKPEDDSGRP